MSIYGLTFKIESYTEQNAGALLDTSRLGSVSNLGAKILHNQLPQVLMPALIVFLPYF